ncbi:hypothetical protein IU469_34620, partial [Nocardia puris]|uniref:hypothetical protein n=2 Tax=Nocardiaceae TaxID=85025 RepID=UPI001895D232
MTTGLSDAHQLQIENTIKQISDLHPVEGTYLTGSLAADLGSTLSDLDLVCVVATAEPVQRFPLRGELALHEGTVADAEVLTTSQYGATTKIVNAWNPDATGHWKVFGLREELRTLSRLLYGRPVT